MATLTLRKSKLKERAGVGVLFPDGISDLSLWPSSTAGDPTGLYECDEAAQGDALTDAIAANDLTVYNSLSTADMPQVAVAGFAGGREGGFRSGPNRQAMGRGTQGVGTAFTDGFAFAWSGRLLDTTSRAICGVSDMHNVSIDPKGLQWALYVNGGYFRIAVRRTGAGYASVDSLQDAATAVSTGKVYNVLGGFDFRKNEIWMRITEDGVTADIIRKRDQLFTVPEDVAACSVGIGGARLSSSLGSASNFLGSVTGRLALWEDPGPWYLPYAGVVRAERDAIYAADTAAIHFVGDSLTNSSFIAQGSRFCEIVATAKGKRMVGHGFPSAGAPVIDGHIQALDLGALAGDYAVVWSANNSITDPAANMVSAQATVNRLLDAGCSKVVVLGCPNRELDSETDPAIAVVQADLDTYNSGMSAWCDLYRKVTFLDLHDEFINDTNGYWTAAGGDTGTDATERGRGIIGNSARYLATNTHLNAKGDLLIATWLNAVL